MSRINVHRGWVVMAAAFLSAGLAVGTGQYSFGVFVRPLENEFGWSRTQVNAGISFSAIAILSGPIIGRIMDRFGARPVMILSLIVLGISFAFRPWMTQLWHWYVLGILQAVAAIGATTLPAARLVGIWFQKTRGRVMGLVTMGNNFGGLTMAAMAGMIVASHGWRWGYGVFTLLGLLVTLLVFLTVQERTGQPHRLAQERDDLGEKGDSTGGSTSEVMSGMAPRDACRTKAFFLIFVGFLAAGFPHAAVLSQLIPHLENEGISLPTASLALSVLAGFGMGGKFLFGLLTERIPARYAFALCLAFQILGVLMLARWPNTPLLWVYMPFYGLAFGAVGALSPLLIQETFGLRHFGSIQGFLGMSRLLPMVVGPLMMGAFYDSMGHYRIALLVVACIFAVGALAFVFANPPRRSTATDMPI